MSMPRMTCRVMIVTALCGCGPARTAQPPPLPPNSTSAAELAAQLELKAEAELQARDSSSEVHASELFAEAGKQWRIAGNDSASAAAFERAGASARLAGNQEQAFRYYGTAVQTRDSVARGRLHKLLESSPLELRDPEEEARFVGPARDLVVDLGVLTPGEAAGEIRSAVDAYAVLEDMAAAGEEVPVTLRSTTPGLEVRLRRWVRHFQEWPWTTLRTDTTVSQPPMRYEFCYLDPHTHKPVTIDQQCADGCTLVLPSAHAKPATSC